MSKRCKICGQAVYPMDPQINLDGSLFHKQCAKCKDCNCQITLTNFVKNESEKEMLLLCKTHYLRRFKENNSYVGDERFAKRKAINSGKEEISEKNGPWNPLSCCTALSAQDLTDARFDRVATTDDDDVDVPADPNLDGGAAVTLKDTTETIMDISPREVEVHEKSATATGTASSSAAVGSKLSILSPGNDEKVESSSTSTSAMSPIQSAIQAVVGSVMGSSRKPDSASASASAGGPVPMKIIKKRSHSDSHGGSQRGPEGEGGSVSDENEDEWVSCPSSPEDQSKPTPEGRDNVFNCCGTT